MKRKKNFRAEILDQDFGSMTVDTDEVVDPNEFPPWFIQIRELTDEQRKEITKKALEGVQKQKPAAFDFIKNFNCELVGICPRIEYALMNSRDGETDVTWVHGFSVPTLLFWCKQGKFGFFVNANLDYNDTVLNKVKGNPKQRLKGFTA